MTEELIPETMQEFGDRMGRVIRFFNRKGYGLSAIFKKTPIILCIIQNYVLPMDVVVNCIQGNMRVDDK